MANSISRWGNPPARFLVARFARDAAGGVSVTVIRGNQNRFAWRRRPITNQPAAAPPGHSIRKASRSRKSQQAERGCRRVMPAPYQPDRPRTMEPGAFSERVRARLLRRSFSRRSDGAGRAAAAIRRRPTRPCPAPAPTRPLCSETGSRPRRERRTCGIRRSRY